MQGLTKFINGEVMLFYTPHICYMSSLSVSFICRMWIQSTANALNTTEVLPALLTVVELMSLMCCEMSGTVSLKSLLQDDVSETVSNSLIITIN